MPPTDVAATAARSYPAAAAAAAAVGAAAATADLLAGRGPGAARNVRLHQRRLPAAEHVFGTYRSFLKRVPVVREWLL